MAQKMLFLPTSSHKVSDNPYTQYQINKYKSSSNTTIKTQNKKIFFSESDSVILVHTYFKEKLANNHGGRYRLALISKSYD